MNKKYHLLAIGFLTCAAGTPAMAEVHHSTADYGYLDFSPSSKVITFDAPNPAGFTVTGGSVRNYSDGYGAEPAISDTQRDTSNYISANANDDATIMSTKGYRLMSLLWGSMDSYNTISLLDKLGNSFQSDTGNQIWMPSNGDQQSNTTNRRVTFTTSGDTSAIYGVRLSSTSPAFEADNIAFAAPVPEPSVWLSMGAGLGLAGFMARRRSKKATIA